MDTDSSAELTPTTRAVGRSLFADAMLGVAVLGWAVSFPIAKMALTEWQHFKFAFLAGRFWLAFALFLPVAWRMYGVRTLVNHLRPGAVVGLTLVVTYAFQFEALRLPGTSGEVAFITAFSSVLVPPFMWLLFRARVHAVTLFGLLIATIGVIVMTVTDTLGLSMSAALAVVGAIGVALDTILISHYRGMETAPGVARYETLPFLVTQFLTVAVGTTVLALAWELPNHGTPPWSTDALFGMVFMAVIATGAAFYLQTRFQRDTTPDRAALIFTVEPAAAAVFSYLLIGEVFTWRMLLGAALILMGVGGSEFLAARREMQENTK